MSPRKGFQFAIDRGGTFTDVYARCPNGKVRVMKLLSVDPQNYDDAPREAIRRILQEETGNALDSSGKVNSSLIESIRMGTTVATNALLERKGAKVALVINRGFKDLLLIGNQARPHIFQLDIKRPGVLYTCVVEVDCRVIPALEDRCLMGKVKEGWKTVVGSTGEKMLITKDLDEQAVREDLKALREKGIDSIAVVLAHSYTFYEHEIRIGKIAESLGFTQVSLSHSVTSMVRMVPRGFTACADAYLTPHIRDYVSSFAEGFSDRLVDTNVLFMQSDGGLTPMNMFNGSRAILSGPAGGVVGYAMTSYYKETGLPVIGFDMGGTSTDVSRYAGTLEHVHEATTAGVTIQAPQLDINTVAAGGGSLLTFRSGLFCAGPESCGAHPGPACYRKGTLLALTDANLLLGRLLPEYFPKIFGPNENEPLDKHASIAAFKKITQEINSFLKQDGRKEMTMEEIAMGFINVANEAMCRPIRALTTARGHDASRHALACFGGAGGQHACAVARQLAIHTVYIHKYAGILSAYGMALAHVVQESQTACAWVYNPDHYHLIDRQLDVLAAVSRDKLRAHGISDSKIVIEPYLHLRYSGTDCALMVSPVEGKHSCKHGDFYTAFVDRYKSEFGFTLSDRDVIVDDIRVRAVGLSEVPEDTAPPSGKGTEPVVEKKTKVFFDGGYQNTSVYLLEKLKPEQVVNGPAIIMDNLSTILVEPECHATITKFGDICITIGSGKRKQVTAELDPIQLSIFGHRFMSIAEQMGRVLQRTSISVNIKERLDFSCALFGPDGGLVSNAPHIPVHLGAMQDTVQYQMKVRGDTLKEGDVILANHPKAGGSHLPDLTVITPVFHKSKKRPIFFVASRGHHADIGGLTPGSMPPHSTSLAQEGAAFKSMLLVDGSKFDEKGLTEELMKPGKVPGCSGTRNLADNLSDLKAQVAANQRGIQLVGELIDQYGLDVVQAYMHHIQNNAELAVRDMLREIAKKTYEKTGATVLKATEYMDNGTPIVLTITLDKDEGTAHCDFTGTGVEVWGNLNAPRAITLSALIYCLRCMVGHDVPLNQGCLKPVHVTIPQGSILDPSEGAAVVGGNVLTSQRIVDVVLKAFQVCAASQGCMNNLTLGESDWGYYETVAGGSGAGPGYHGTGGVHTHMTNTRITDVEIVERRYPMLVERFQLRPNSGGRGRWNGGDGIIRELVFRRSVQLSVLTERRAFQPYGMNGGLPGERGLNLIQRTDGRLINLGGKASIQAYPGDKYIMNSPSGGGYGTPGTQTDGQADSQTTTFVERGSLYEYRSAQESVDNAMKYDLIIVGSGSVGAAAGYYASQSGLKVLMIDSYFPPHDQGSHHGDTRLMRHAYGEGEKYVPLVLRAQKLWDFLAEISGVKVFHKTGVINLGPADSSFIGNIASSAEKFSLPVEKLNAAAITARWPEIVVPENYVGIFESNAGVLKSELAVRAYIDLAKKSGSTQLFNCRVTDIRYDEGVTVVTQKGEYQGRKLLISAGTWVTKLLPKLPITPTRKIFSRHQADDRYSEKNNFPGFTTVISNGDMIYGFPAEDNKLKIAKHNGGQKIDAPEQRLPFGQIESDGSEVSIFLRDFLPGIGCCLEGKACTYDMSPDEDFIIDILPGHDNTLIITGLSGHGFKFASVLGEIACHFALGQKPAFDLSPFRLSRFKMA